MDQVQGNRFLVTAAMTHYSRDPKLDRPELISDVERVANVFTTEFGYAHIRLPGDGPTHGQLRDGLRDFCKASERSPDDMVAVYLTCHGAILEPDDFVLLPSDIDPDDLVPLGVTPQVLIDWLLRDTKVRRLLLMLDTCYSGQGGQDAATAAVRWINQPGTVDRPGVAVITATHPWQSAQPGVFSHAFVRAVGHLASGGYAPEYLPLDAVVGAINADPEKPASQTVACHLLGITGLSPPFLPNRRHRPRLINVDLLEQERARHAEQREIHLRDRFMPATRWFTGREAALTDLARWLDRPAADARALIVTGNAGSGKTALLGLFAMLSDPEQAPSVPRDGLPEAFSVTGSPIAEAIYAGTMTTEQVRDRIAAAANVRVETTQELIENLNQRDADPYVVLIDALDEAVDPTGLINGLLNPLMTECVGTVRLLLGTRPHLLTARLLGTPESHQYLLVDLDGGVYADPASIQAYVRRILLAEDSLDSAYRPSGLYRTAPSSIVNAVTEAIRKAAGSSFLVARITATTEAASAQLPDLRDPAWRTALPHHAGQAIQRDLRLRLGVEADKAKKLLLPLAYAQGNGLPWENIWPCLVEALSPGSDYHNNDLIWLRRTAGSYAVEGIADGRSAYRLYHQAVTEYLLQGRDLLADQRAITNALIVLAPLRPGGGRDWAAAHPYIRTFLATHAAQAGCIDDLLDDPAYLLNAAPPQLLAGLSTAISPHAKSIADAYHHAARHLRAKHAREHASYLQLAARCGRAPDLADALETYRPVGTWSAKWASWHPQTPHQAIRDYAHSGINTLVVALINGQPVVISCSVDGRVHKRDLASGAPLGSPFAGHTGTVDAVAVAELDGRPVLVGGHRDGTIRVWDLASGAPVGVLFTGHTREINTLAVAELDARPVVVGGLRDGTIRVWDLASGAPVGDPFTAHTSWVTAFAVAELDGRPVVVSGGSGDSVSVWDLASGAPVGDPFTAHTSWVTALAVAELDGRPVVVSGGADRTMRVWDLASGTPVGDPFTAHTSWVTALAVAELDGRPVVVSGGADRTMRVWDLASGTPLGDPFTAHTSAINTVTVAELDGRSVVLGGDRDGMIRVWDLAYGARLGDPFTGHTGWVNAVAMAELDGRPVVVSGGSDGSVRVWDLASGARAGNPFTGHTGAVNVVTTGQLHSRPVVICGGSDGSVRVWDLASGARAGNPFTGHTGAVSAVAVAELDGRPVVISGGADHIVRVWDLASGAPVGDPFTGHTGAVSAVAVAELDGRPVVISGGRAVQVWDLASGTRLGGPFTMHIGWVRAVAVAELDGRPVVVSGGTDHIVRVWDLASGAPVGDPFIGHTDWINAVAVAELDGRPVVVSGGADRKVRVWDLASGAPLGGSFTSHSGFTNVITTLAVGERDGRPVVVCGGSDGSVRVWDLASGTSIGASFTGHTRWVNAVAVAELDDRPVVISGGDRTMRVWDLVSGAPLSDPVTSETGLVHAVTTGQLHDRPVVVSGGTDGWVRVWDLASGAPVGDPFTGHTGAVSAVAVAELDGRPVVVSGGSDGSVRVWDLASGAPVGDPFTGHTGAVNAVAVAELGGRPVVLSGSSDGSVRVWDLAKGRAVRRLFRRIQLDHGVPVLATIVASCARQTTVITGCSDGTSQTWDLVSGQSLSRVAIQGGSPISAIVLLPLDQVLYANGSTLHLYVAGQQSSVVTIELDSSILALAECGTSVVASTMFGLVVLDIPQQ